MIIEQPAMWLRWLYPKAIWRMDKHDHSVYLTFDDGPIPESTPFILDTLKEYGAKATFFMVGENVLRYHDLYWWVNRYYKIIMWDLVTRDYSKWMTAQGVVNNVKRYARNGSIITFHDSLKAIDKLKTALPESLRWLKEQGYEFKTFE